MKKFKQWVFDKYFASEKRLIELLVQNQDEMKEIALEQIVHIQELEDKIAHYDYREEDLELEVERLKDRVDDLERDLDDAMDEKQSLEWDNDRLEDQVADLQYELQNKEEF
jgi:chromosome segregation ATPase